MAATTFCPPPFMRLAWQGTQQEAPTMDRVDDLVTYFDRTWVNQQLQTVTMELL